MIDENIKCLNCHYTVQYMYGVLIVYLLLTCDSSSVTCINNEPRHSGHMWYDPAVLTMQLSPKTIVDTVIFCMDV